MSARLSMETDGHFGLEDYDRAMLWALRCVAAGRLDCPSLRRTFLDLCGRTADQLLCGLLVMVRLLADRRQGGLRLHLPGSSEMSGDERAILSALVRLRDEREAAAAAAELEGRLGVRADGSLTAAFLYLGDLFSGGGNAPGSRSCRVGMVR